MKDWFSWSDSLRIVTSAVKTLLFGTTGKDLLDDREYLRKKLMRVSEFSDAEKRTIVQWLEEDEIWNIANYNMNEQIPLSEIVESKKRLHRMMEGFYV